MKLYFTFIFIILSASLQGQNTVGTIKNNVGSYNGYTLLAPLTSNETYLINNCGEILNQWSSDYFPGNSVYLLENGNLLRAGRGPTPSINFGGVGGKIQLFNWEGVLLWEYTHSSATFVQHHDIYPLPNGNILMLSAEVISGLEALSEGRNPSFSITGEVYNEQILELKPVGTDQATIVWSWNVKDHLIQDFDATKNNFGDVGENPQRLDFNYVNSPAPGANWLHVNSIQYNESLDQIILSSRILSEIYIIDHSTTSEESASSAGGTYGKGGDFLYRWGNPEAYRHGTSDDRTLFGQHYPHFIPQGLTDEGKIMIFNNSPPSTFSSVDIIDPATTSPGVYSYDSATGYGPSSAEWQYSATEDINFSSPILSSGQRLPNGNTLICDGNSGHIYEIDTNNTIVWDYVNPDTAAGIVTQGNTPTQNAAFRALKYAPDFPGFSGRDLTPGEPIELNPDLSGCENLSVNDYNLTDLKLYPNPTSNIVNVRSKFPIEKIELYNTLGALVKVVFNAKSIELNTVESGIYFMTVHSHDAKIIKRIIKQ